MKAHNKLELWRGNELKFSFPEIHEDAILGVRFMRTLRVPDNDGCNSLPPGLGSFELRHVADYKDRLPASWARHGGVMLPMWQAEAMWISLENPYDYPFAVRVGAGKICAVSGKRWKRGLERSVRLKRDGTVKRTQNYLASPAQPWLDGFNVTRGEVRQFVAMPLGQGVTVEEQLTGKAEVGGLQLEVFPMRAEAYQRIYGSEHLRENGEQGMTIHVDYCLSNECALGPGAEMGLGAGGSITQEIESDEHELTDYEATSSLRVFVHLLNSSMWSGVTGEAMPRSPVSAEDYTKAGLPWFDYYSDGEAAEGAALLSGVKSVNELTGKFPGDQHAKAPAKVVLITGKVSAKGARG
ncbi:MAG: hypothetical protein K6A65_08495 [Succinivibrionaceae bacterium]|nr:hypothetical protein [Succinivibrionaceae bacterium]